LPAPIGRGRGSAAYPARSAGCPEVAAAAGPDPAPRLDAASADLAQIKKAAERAAALTHQLLVFARREVVRPQVIDLDSVITTVEELLRRTIGEHTELIIVCGSATPAPG
jgi:two-component system, cell cycle sensor histidine kinase and response regulator CckA